MSTDIAGAYGCDDLKSLRRSFSFNESRVTMRDHFEYYGSGELTERLVSLEMPRLVSDGEICVDGITVRFDPMSCTVSISSETRINGDKCYFMDFKLKSGARTFACEIG